MDRAVRVMAGGAVLLDRRVVEHERSALVGVARVALIVDRRLLHHHRGERPVWVMAVAALDLSLDDRVVRGLEGLRADVLVAGPTDLRLVRLEGRGELVD